MQRVWSFGVLLALTGCVSAGDGSPGIGTYTYNDVLRPHGHERGNAAEQAATRICDGGDRHRIGTAKFDACMRGRGWRLADFEPTPQQSSPSYDVGTDPAPTSSPDFSNQAAADAMAASAANAAAQQQNDAANAATVQTEYQFNTIYNAPN
ncbi:MAG: hypothetical protein ACHQAY_09650 [Hyphomicrobiales bacterium]